MQKWTERNEWLQFFLVFLYILDNFHKIRLTHCHNAFLRRLHLPPTAGSSVFHSWPGWIFHMATDDVVNYRWQDKQGSLASIRRGHEVTDLHSDCQCLLHTTHGQRQWGGLGWRPWAGVRGLPLHSFNASKKETKNYVFACVCLEIYWV